jgi:hypothetical protein
MVLAMSSPAFADSGENLTTEYLPDGSYYETIIETSSPSFSLFATSSTKSGSKTVNYKNSSGTVLWYVKVSGSFTYNGSTSSCTSSTVTAASQSSYWTISGKSASKSGNVATASATAKRYSGSIVVQTVNETIHLTCSANGTLS